MTALLATAVKQASKLPPQEQDRLATLLLAHLDAGQDVYQRPPQGEIDAAVEGILALQKQFRLDGLRIKDMMDEGRAA